MPTLEAKTRDLKVKLDTLRKEGFIPAVFYGRKEKSTPIVIKKNDFDKVFKTAGESTVVTLSGDFGTVDAMIHQVDRDPISGTTQHADFYAVEKDKKINIHVPIEFTGVAPAVKELGGILVKVLHEVEIEALPGNLPHSLSVDVVSLVDFDSHIVAGDIALPSGVSLVTKEDEIVASVSKPKEEVEESAPIDLSSIEVEKKGKEVKEDTEAEA